jgi:hypothetical protein
LDELGERAAARSRRLLRLAKEQRGHLLGTSAFLLELAPNGRAQWRRSSRPPGRRRASVLRDREVARGIVSDGRECAIAIVALR